MFIKWQADGDAAPTEFQFDPDEVTSKQGQAIEKAMGGAAPSFEVWLELVRVGNMRARAVLLWHLLRQAHPNMALTDVPDFRRKQLQVEMSVAELQVLRDQIGKAKMDDATREAFEMQFDRDIADAMERETGVIAGEITDGASPKHL